MKSKTLAKLARPGRVLRRTLVVLSVLLCALLWARAIHTLAVLPPPPQVLQWVDADGEAVDEADKGEFVPGLIVGDVYWRPILRSTYEMRHPTPLSETPPGSFWLARFNPRAGRVEVDWRIPSGRGGLATGLKRLDDHSLLLATLEREVDLSARAAVSPSAWVLDPDAEIKVHTTFHRFRAQGEIQSYPPLPGKPLGFEVVGDRLEVVVATDDEHTRVAWIPVAGGAWMHRNNSPFVRYEDRFSGVFWRWDGQWVGMKDGVATRDAQADASQPGSGWSVWLLSHERLDAVGPLAWVIWRLDPDDTWRPVQTLDPAVTTGDEGEPALVNPDGPGFRSTGAHRPFWLREGRWAPRRIQPSGKASEDWAYHSRRLDKNGRMVPTVSRYIGGTENLEPSIGGQAQHSDPDSWVAKARRLGRKYAVWLREPPHHRTSLGTRHVDEDPYRRIALVHRLNGWAMQVSTAGADGTFSPPLEGPPIAASGSQLGVRLDDGVGGHWLVSIYGDCLHVNAALERDDLPGLGQRIVDWAHRLTNTRDWMRRHEEMDPPDIDEYGRSYEENEQAFLKGPSIPRWRLAAIPMGLFGLPVLVLLLIAIRRTRRWAWIGAVLVWAALVLPQISWIWRALGPLWL